MATSIENRGTIRRFGEFELDPAAGELRRRGIRIKLQEQPLQVLTILVRRPGQLVTREELRKTLWPADTFVDFDHSLNSAVMRLREALGDSAENPSFVETIPKRGYRFLAPVTPVAPLTIEPAPAISGEPPPLAPQNGTAPAIPTLPAVPHERRFGFFRRYWLAIAAVIVIIGPFAVWFSLRQSSVASRGKSMQSVVVLPIENLTGDKDQEYLADGVTDELTAGLAKMRSLRVISRTSAMSYKGTRKTLPQIARELNADAVVEGTLRRSGSRIRITTELIQAASDRHIWVETYDTEFADVLATEANAVRSIAKELGVRLTPQEQSEIAARSMRPAAHEAYLKGRYYWNKRTAESLKRAIGYFEEAIRQDPSSALAYSGLADCYDILASVIVEAVPTREAYPKAKEAALKAVQLDDSLAEAHTSLATMSFNYDWDWAAAQHELKRALEINPNYATAHQRYSLYLIAMGRLTESVAEMVRARELDPMSVSINFSLGWRLYFARRYDEAITQLRSTLEMDPNFVLAHRVLGQALEQKHQYDQALSELETAARLSGNAPLVLGPLGEAYARAGKTREAMRVLQEMQASAGHVHVSSVHIAEVYVGLGDHAAAMRWLERAYQDRANDLVFLKVNPEFDVLRSDAEFKSLLQRIGLP